MATAPIDSGSAAWRLVTPDPGRRRYMPLALTLSLCAHGLLLFWHLAGPRPMPSSSPLEVTLVNTRSEAEPLQPQLLAQHALNAGGNAQSGIASSPLPHTAADTPEQIVLRALRKRQEELEAEQQALYAQLVARDAVPEARKQPDLFQHSADPGQDDMTQDSLLINARIHALRERIEQYNAQPRQRFVGPSTEAAEYAQYVESWRARIEQLGTEHYPDQARGKVYGKLRLTVYIQRNGDLLRVQVDQPSEHAVLNLAAQRIVRLAAPFAPLPPQVARNTDVLAITRTWNFTNDQLSTSAP